MHRLTARVLMLLALAGNVIPLAMAITAAPPHACCMRMAHHCHEAASADAGKLVFRDPCCCNSSSRRAATTAQWAHPKTRSTQVGAPAVERLVRRAAPDRALRVRNPRVRAPRAHLPSFPSPKNESLSYIGAGNFPAVIWAERRCARIFFRCAESSFSAFEAQLQVAFPELDTCKEFLCTSFVSHGPPSS